MKKLLTILVILMLFMAFYASAEKVKFPGVFNIEEKLKFETVDGSNMASGDSPTWDAQTVRIRFRNEAKITCKFKITDIFTMVPWLKSIYILSSDATLEELSMHLFLAGLNTSISIPNIMKIGINANWMIWNLIRPSSVTNKAYRVNYKLTPSVSLSGGDYGVGLKWSLAQAVYLCFDAQNWKDNNPLHIDDTASAAANTHYYGLFSGAVLETSAGLSFEFFHFFAPENIKGSIKLSQKFIVSLPYSYYDEYTKQIATEGVYGLDFNLAGVGFFVGAKLKTQDYYNTSVPYAETETGADAHGKGFKDTDFRWSNWANADTSHPAGRGQLGPYLTFSVGKDIMAFGVAYWGYAQIRDYDPDGENYTIGNYAAITGVESPVATARWQNELLVWIKIKL